MDAVLFAGEACRSYTERDGRAGTIEYIHCQYKRGRIYTLRGTSANKGRWGWLAKFRDLGNDALIAVPSYHPEMGAVPMGVKIGAMAMLSHIAREHTKTNPLYLCGHSLGGAVAARVADVLAARGYNVYGVMTFNAPRGGSLPHLAGLDIPAIAYRHEGDLVSCTPPYWPHGIEPTTVGSKTLRGNHSMRRMLGVLTQLNP